MDFKINHQVKNHAYSPYDNPLIYHLHLSKIQSKKQMVYRNVDFQPETTDCILHA